MASPYDSIPGKIFIGGVSPVTSQETIQRYFEQFGELCDCVLMQDKTTGKSRGFGFVTYKEGRILDKVLSKSHMIDGKEVDCKRAIPRDQQGELPKEETSGRTKKLFVGGLPQTLSEEDFRAYFEQFGSIEDSVIMVDKDTGKSRGFGFVTFDSEDAVEQVIQRYYDNKIDGKWVECKRAQPKDIGNVAPKKGGGGKFGAKDNYSTSTKNYYAGSEGSQRSSRSQHTQDTYGDDSYSSGHSQGSRQPPYSGYQSNYQGYNMGYQQGYDPNMGYQGDYNQGYGNPYPNPYAGGYSQGYPNQYGQPNYMAQGYQGDMGYGNMGYYQQGGHQSHGQGGHGHGHSHGHSHSYNKGQSGYGGHGNANQRQMGRGEEDSGSHKQNNSNVSQQQQQVQNSNQNMNAMVEDPSVGPAKGVGNKKQEIENRYYTPY